MRKFNFFKSITLILVGVSALTSCVGKRISREQALQILDQIIVQQEDPNFTLLGPTLVVSSTTKSISGLDVLQKEEEIHVVQSEGLGRSFIYYFTETYLGNKKIESLEYWAFNRNGQFNEITKKGELVKNQETNVETFDITSNCKYITDIVESAATFWSIYGTYYNKAAELVRAYDTPNDFKDGIISIDSLKEQNYKVSERYTTTGNRNIICDIEVRRPTVNNDRHVYKYGFVYNNAKLTSYTYNNSVENIYQHYEMTTTSNLIVPSSCDIPTTH